MFCQSRSHLKNPKLCQIGVMHHHSRRMTNRTTINFSLRRVQVRLQVGVVALQVLVVGGVQWHDGLVLLYSMSKGSSLFVLLIIYRSTIRFLRLYYLISNHNGNDLNDQWLTTALGSKIESEIERFREFEQPTFKIYSNSKWLSTIVIVYYKSLQFDSVIVDCYSTAFCYSASAGYKGLHNARYPADEVQHFLRFR